MSADAIDFLSEGTPFPLRFSFGDIHHIGICVYLIPSTGFPYLSVLLGVVIIDMPAFQDLSVMLGVVIIDMPELAKSAPAPNKGFKKDVTKAQKKEARSASAATRRATPCTCTRC